MLNASASLVMYVERTLPIHILYLLSTTMHSIKNHCVTITVNCLQSSSADSISLSRERLVSPSSISSSSSSNSAIYDSAHTASRRTITARRYEGPSKICPGSVHRSFYIGICTTPNRKELRCLFLSTLRWPTHH
jgi:hypothetical protein